MRPRSRQCRGSGRALRSWAGQLSSFQRRDGAALVTHGVLHQRLRIFRSVAWTTSADPQASTLFELSVLRREAGGATVGADPATAAQVTTWWSTSPVHRAIRAPLDYSIRGSADIRGRRAGSLGGDLPVIEIVNELDGAVMDRGQPSGKSRPAWAATGTVMARTLSCCRRPVRPLVPQLHTGDGGANANHLCVAWRVRRSSEIIGCALRRIGVSWRYAGNADVWRSGAMSDRPGRARRSGHRFMPILSR